MENSSYIKFLDEVLFWLCRDDLTVGALKHQVGEEVCLKAFQSGMTSLQFANSIEEAQ